MKKISFALTCLFIFSIILAGCQSSSPAETGETNTNQAQEPAAAADLLADVLARGYVIVSTDPAYPPQSQLVENVERMADTKCPSELRTSNELQGFDIEVAKEFAKRLGVEVCFITPDWTLITGGNWAGRWDVSIGSMTVTPERMEKLYFSQPYYTTPAAFFVHKDNSTFQAPADLAGMRIGACTGCTYDAYLAGTLQIPGETMNYVVSEPQFAGYETDINALQDLALGDGVRLEAVLTALPTGEGAINDGLPLKQLGDPVYFEYLSAAVDKASVKDPRSFVEKISEIFNNIHADGTMAKLSQEFYGLDLASAAAKFDVDSLNQFAK